MSAATPAMIEEPEVQPNGANTEVPVPDATVVPGASALPDAATLKAINEPGCYVSKRTGTLLRIPESAIEDHQTETRLQGASVTAAAVEQPLATKISDDPFITITRARLLAASRDVTVKF